MKWPSGVPWTMPKWCTTYVVEKCDVMWKLPHPVLTGGSETQLQKLTSGIDLSNYNLKASRGTKVGWFVSIKRAPTSIKVGVKYCSEVAGWRDLCDSPRPYNLGSLVGGLPALPLPLASEKVRSATAANRKNKIR
ncbi:hypothetical protein AVEN_257363-1 [Araneus ventricosus]|uniref:Uncharacterized protein n=1 Tax=Araneus ventricosus TaxID=182803 RepID=A0A4Y2C8T7_ARAVE|nr:hypothetical protein AVEN_257363-1 [Araneus ventricosus]